MKPLLKDLFTLFYPKFCVNCATALLEQEKILCIHCYHELPVININNFKENEIINCFYGSIPIHEATAFLYYRKHGIAQKLIQELKYHGQQKIGEFLGKQFANKLKEKQLFQNIDFIIPVPLHKNKLKKRGYNQVATFGKTLSSILCIPYKDDILTRISNESSQTLKKRFERFSNNETRFKLTNSTILENKHILLIDDVITTGATLISCGHELLKTKNITLSIATIAYTQKD